MLTQDSIEQQILDLVDDNIRVTQEFKKYGMESVINAAKVIVEALQNGKKIMACGNGGSHADAMHFVAELVNRFEKDRPELASVCLGTNPSNLTSIGNDYSFNEIFSKEVNALANPQDVLVVFTTSGNSPNIIRAIQAAHHKGCIVVAFLGKDGGKVAHLLNLADIKICVQNNSTARIQEVHGLMIHCICSYIEKIMFTSKE